MHKNRLNKKRKRKRRVTNRQEISYFKNRQDSFHSWDTSSAVTISDLNDVLVEEKFSSCSHLHKSWSNVGRRIGASID